MVPELVEKNMANPLPPKEKERRKTLRRIARRAAITLASTQATLTLKERHHLEFTQLNKAFLKELLPRVREHYGIKDSPRRLKR